MLMRNARVRVTAVLLTLLGGTAALTVAPAASAVAAAGDPTVATSCTAAGTVSISGSMLGQGDPGTRMALTLNTAYGSSGPLDVLIGQVGTITIDTHLAQIPAGTVTFFFAGVFSGGDGAGTITVPFAARTCSASPPDIARCGNGSVVLAAFGSGQTYAGERNLDPSLQLRAVYSAIVSTAGSRRPAARVIYYPAPSVGVLLSGDLSTAWNPVQGLGSLFYSHTAQYLSGESEGVAGMWSSFNAVRRDCPPGTKFALIGYSQGAMVVHDFLTQLAATNASLAKAAIVGAVLVADPERVKHSQVLELGDSSWSSYGVCDVLSVGTACAAEGAALTDIPAQFRSRTVSVCLSEDPVCSTSDDVPTLVSLIARGDGQRLAAAAFGWYGIHLSYDTRPETTTAGKLVGRWLASS